MKKLMVLLIVTMNITNGYSQQSKMKELLDGFVLMNMDTTNWFWDSTKIYSKKYELYFAKGWCVKERYLQYAEYFDKDNVLIGAEDSLHQMAPYATPGELALIYMSEMLRVNGIKLEYYFPKSKTQEENFNSLFGGGLPELTLCYLTEKGSTSLAGFRTNKGFLFIRFYMNKKGKISEVDFEDSKNLITKEIYPFASK